MPSLTLKPTHKAVTAYYDSLAKFAKLGIKYETAVRSAFHELLESCARQFDWKLVTERIFRKIFDVADFISRNVIAQEIEKLIAALNSRLFSLARSADRVVEASSWWLSKAALAGSLLRALTTDLRLALYWKPL